jgi:P4 family phage/plasmid primase-like protien
MENTVQTKTSIYTDINKINKEEEYINFQNGVLDINKMELLPHTDEIFSAIQIPCNWSEKNIETPVFDKFLTTLTNGNKGNQRLLLEYIGAIISNIYGYRFKKCIFLVGESKSGKSVLLSLIRDLVGSNNTCPSVFSRISQPFGQNFVYMKRFIFSDILSNTAEQIRRFNELINGDTICVEFIERDPIDYQFQGLMMFEMRKLPDNKDFSDSALIIKCNNIIPKNEQDQHLLEKLFAEREGIIRKCVLAFREVLNNNFQFHIPEECNINCK